MASRIWGTPAWLACLALGLGVMATSTAQAQASPEVVARLQSMLQEATAARARLERENARLQRDLTAAEKKVKSLESSRKKLNSQLSRTSNEVDTLEASNVQAQQRYTALREGWDRLLGGCTETVYIMRDIERERASFVERLAARNADLARCIDVNENLQGITDELLTRLEAGDRGPVKTLVRHEPFTGLSKVRLQNEIDDYRYEIGNLLVENPDDLPLIAPPGSTQSIDGRWACELATD